MENKVWKKPCQHEILSETGKQPIPGEGRGDPESSIPRQADKKTSREVRHLIDRITIFSTLGKPFRKRRHLRSQHRRSNYPGYLDWLCPFCSPRLS